MDELLSFIVNVDFNAPEKPSQCGSMTGTTINKTDEICGGRQKVRINIQAVKTSQDK